MTEQWTWASVKRIREAAEEMKELIRTRYPDARFHLVRAADDRHIWHLWTLVDLEDPEQINVLVRGRELEMQVDEHIPLYVIPTRDEERFTEELPAKAVRTG